MCCFLFLSTSIYLAALRSSPPALRLCESSNSKWT